MAEPDKKLTLSNGTVSLYKHVQFKDGEKLVCTADRMVVEHLTGNEEHVVILREKGTLIVKRLVLQIEVGSGGRGGGASFADLGEEAVERYLALYAQVSKGVPQEK